MGNILKWEGLISSARLQEMAVDGLLNRYLLLALQHSHLYYDSLEKAKAVSAVMLLQLRTRIAPLFVKSVERENGPGGENGAQNTGSEKRAPQF